MYAQFHLLVVALKFQGLLPDLCHKDGVCNHPCMLYVVNIALTGCTVLYFKYKPQCSYTNIRFKVYVGL